MLLLHDVLGKSDSGRTWEERPDWHVEDTFGDESTCKGLTNNSLPLHELSSGEFICSGLAWGKSVSGESSSEVSV